MKKINLFIALIYISSCSLLHAQGKQLKEGKAVYEMSMPGTDTSEMMAGMMPKKMTIYFKDGSTRVETASMMGNVTVINAKGDGDYYTLMDMMGEKYALKMTDVDMSAFKEMYSSAGLDKPEVKITDEKKKIAGFKCTKAIITYKGKDETYTTEAWFTEDVMPVASPMMQTKIEGLNGFLISSTTKTSKGILKMTCTSIDKTPVADDMFKVPEGYTVKNMSELMGGMK